MDVSEIKYFTNLTNLYCSDNQLTYLDVSHNAQLEVLWCYDNQLTVLNCYCNQLTQLDVSYNLGLTSFGCSYNPLEELVLAEQQKNFEWYADVYNEYSGVLVVK